MARRKPETLIQIGIRLFMRGTIAEAEQLLEIGAVVVAGRKEGSANFAARKPVRTKRTTPSDALSRVEDAPDWVRDGAPAPNIVTITAPPSAVTASERRRRSVARKRQEASAAAGVVAPKRGRGRPRLVTSQGEAPGVEEPAVLGAGMGTPLESIPQSVDE